MSSLPLYLLFIGGWCLGFVMAFVTAFDHYQKEIKAAREAGELTGFREGYRRGLSDRVAEVLP
jgi:hypothetical protein